MAFFVGQKVTMKEDIAWNFPAWRQAHPDMVLPAFGVVYTIRKIRFFDDHGRTGLWFSELRNRRYWFGWRRRFNEPAFHIEAFRPVVSKSTDISVFKRMLAPKPKRKARAPA